MTRGDEVIDALITWKAAGIPPKDILKAMTTYGYQVTQVENERGPIKVGLAADMIAVSGDPLADIDALRNGELRDEGWQDLQAERRRRADEVLQVVRNRIHASYRPISSGPTTIGARAKPIALRRLP